VRVEDYTIWDFGHNLVENCGALVVPISCEMQWSIVDYRPECASMLGVCGCVGGRGGEGGVDIQGLILTAKEHFLVHSPNALRREMHCGEIIVFMLLLNEKISFFLLNRVAARGCNL